MEVIDDEISNVTSNLSRFKTIMKSKLEFSRDSINYHLSDARIIHSYIGFKDWKYFYGSSITIIFNLLYDFYELPAHCKLNSDAIPL